MKFQDWGSPHMDFQGFLVPCHFIYCLVVGIAPWFEVVMLCECNYEFLYRISNSFYTKNGSSDMLWSSYICSLSADERDLWYSSCSRYSLSLDEGIWKDTFHFQFVFWVQIFSVRTIVIILRGRYPVLCYAPVNWTFILSSFVLFRNEAMINQTLMGI